MGCGCAKKAAARKAAAAEAEQQAALLQGEAGAETVSLGLSERYRLPVRIGEYNGRPVVVVPEERRVLVQNALTIHGRNGKVPRRMRETLRSQQPFAFVEADEQFSNGSEGSNGTT